MRNPIYNDQAYIAEKFQLVDDDTTQTARLAFYKIHSYKISLNQDIYGNSKEELFDLLRRSLLQFTRPVYVLDALGYFTEMTDN